MRVTVAAASSQIACSLLNASSSDLPPRARFICDALSSGKFKSLTEKAILNVPRSGFRVSSWTQDINAVRGFDLHRLVSAIARFDFEFYALLFMQGAAAALVHNAAVMDKDI